ncbi:hypothetical protein GF359_10320 [candidate division WOR-3 bacterium]|uniref:DUF2007 domain-containing protein n=1 Tax=candidate division WOR-3 bacterium TaxID=2052148 RepID=A0A9D5QF29_UNCW3|nr:hypothetical protein [candidate division WOR-3 bacterium]MBD3365595.1 hypothetical protein [candidate division WOR-3 bacterium]
MEDYVCVYTCGREEAAVISGLLEASGIEVHLLEEAPAHLRPFSSKKTMVKVLVPREAADFAYQIIKDAQDKDFSDFEQSAEID